MANEPRDAGRPDAGGSRAAEAASETYPAVNQAEAVERTGRVEQVVGEQRSFGEGADVSHQQGWLGAGGDPAEGKP